MKQSVTDQFVRTIDIPGILIINRPTFFDERGFFREIARLSDFGINFKPVQYNHSYSLPKVIRAIHTENMQKLIYPMTGKMFSAFVDTRKDLPSFGKVVEMTFDNTKKPCGYSIFLPAGVGNSICACGNDPIHYIYAVDKYWEPGIAQGIAWDDPDLNIKWPIKNPIISERDKNNPKLRELFTDKFTL